MYKRIQQQAETVGAFDSSLARLIMRYYQCICIRMQVSNNGRSCCNPTIDPVTLEDLQHNAVALESGYQIRMPVRVT